MQQKGSFSMSGKRK